MVRIFALIPSAGTGSRARAAGAWAPISATPNQSPTATPASPASPAASLAKQYQKINGKAVLSWTLDAFTACPAIEKTLVVLAAEDTHGAQLVRNSELQSGGTISFCHAGGPTRGHSVLGGINFLRRTFAAQDADWLLVHDAARCLITPQLIHRLIAHCQAAWQSDADFCGGLLAIPLGDTLKEANAANCVSATLPRANKWLAQTPQMFRVGPLHAALSRALESTPEKITDEASAMELAGYHPRLISGALFNFKITFPEDFALAQQLLGTA